MTEMQIAEALKKHSEGKVLDPGTKKFLYQHGYAEGSTTITNFDSSEKEYLLTFLTPKGQEVMRRHSKL
jgi:hypothetical protein